MKSYCNPLNIPYQYQHFYGKSHPAHREGADPTLVLFHGRYYLFVSMSGGFYYSDDLAHWEYHQDPNLDIYRYAPDVRVLGDELIFSASTQKKSAFRKTKDPMSDVWETVSEPFAFWDPDLFVDDDGRTYFYWGCNTGYPIYAQELDPEKLIPIGDIHELFYDHRNEYGWERHFCFEEPRNDNDEDFETKYRRFRENEEPLGPTYIEGAFMTKHNGKYYLQYAAPGTEFDTYGDGVYVSDAPLGPFTYQKHNPVSFKSGGFIRGAGHGSTVADKYGNYWHSATMRISKNAYFERRVGLFPAGFDEDGIMFCNQNFADYPLLIPDGKFDPKSVRPQYMLLSYGKSVNASSAIPGHDAKYAVDETIRTSWCAKGNRGEWIALDLGETYKIGGIQINLADVNAPCMETEEVEGRDRYIDLDPERRTRWLLESSNDGKTWNILVDKRKAETDLSHDYIAFDTPVEARYLRLTCEEVPYGEAFSVSGLRVFGIGNRQAPAKTKVVSAERIDPLTAKIVWEARDGAQGYNVRYGIAPDKLYLSHMVYGTTDTLLTALNAGTEYYFAVDAFGEGGITDGDVQKL